MDWEPADNTMDAQLHLDAFQRQYDQFVSSHDELVARGRNIAKEIAQLDLVMFGGVNKGSTHPATFEVEKLVEKMESSSARMLKVASPRLQKLKDCLQFHLLQERANKVQEYIKRISIQVHTTSNLMPLSTLTWLRNF